jgi:anti-anti-sigma regulatory factor
MKLVLQGPLTISEAPELRRRLLLALVDESALEIDTRSVTEIDAAGLQLFLATWRSALKNHIPFHFPTDARGPAVQAGLSVLGFGEEHWQAKATKHGEANIGGR